MKRTIIVMAISALLGIGMTSNAQNNTGGNSIEVIPGEWGDEDTKLNFKFEDVPLATYENLRLTLTCGLKNSYILYTTGNADPSYTSSWIRYTKPIELTEDCSVRFYAKCDGYYDSKVQKFDFVFADHQTAAPVIAPNLERTHLIMVSDTPDASIRYTIDGSDPDASAIPYSGPVEMERNATYRARAFSADKYDSNITEYVVDFLKVANPYANFENKKLSFACYDKDVKIYYTTDITAAPEESGKWKVYSTPLSLAEDCTVRFFGRREGKHDSDVQDFRFNYANYQVAVPQLSYNEDGKKVVMACYTPNSEIRYTTDGSEPTSASSLYSKPVVIESNGTFRARAFANGMFDSNIVDFSIATMAVPNVAPVFKDLTLTLSCPDKQADIWFTTDPVAGTDNAEAWTKYGSPLALTEDCAVRFFARRNNFCDSDVQTFSFAYASYQAADPTIERNPAGTHIVMETSTAGGTIHYTTDGSIPTSASPVYSNPILIEHNGVFNAITVAEGMFNSKTNRYVVSNMAVPVPAASFRNKFMTLSCSDQMAQIWYTVNDAATIDDIDAWTLYSKPFTLTGDCTLRFFTRRANFNDSDIESLTFDYSMYQVPAPSVARNIQGTHLVMTSNLEDDNVEIRYSINGSEPKPYTAPVLIEAGKTYKAWAIHPDMFDSEISEYVIGNDKVNAPVAQYKNFQIVLSCNHEGAIIWYQLSNSNTDDWTRYETPLSVTDDCTCRFYASDADELTSDIQTFVFQRADYKVTAPTVERNEAGTHIVMETTTKGGVIRYTTDGSEPTSASTIYAGPILIPCNGTYRAKAFAEGMFDSNVTDFFVNNIAVPVAYATFANKKLALECSDKEAEIWYTTDINATTGNADAWTQYFAPISLSGNCAINFFTRRANFNDSDIETFVFVYANYQVAAPVIARDESELFIEMSCSTEGAKIRYTIDGTEPTAESALYTSPIANTINCTYRAKAFAQGMFDSNASEYVVSNMACAPPFVQFVNKKVVLSAGDVSTIVGYDPTSIWYSIKEGAKIEDTDAWMIYKEPIALTGNCTVSFFARRAGALDSSVQTYEFRYADHQVAQPVITANDNETLIVISCNTQNAVIRYTTDGTVPTAESAIYTSPIANSINCTYKAKAFAEGLFDSAVSEYVVSSMVCAAPSSQFVNKKVVLSAENGNQNIWYSTKNGAKPEDTSAWNLYSGPLSLTKDCTVSFFARRIGFRDSEVCTYEFRYSDHQAAMPVIAPSEGKNVIVISCDTRDAVIRYTTDGSDPKADSKIYDAPINAQNGMKIRARAFSDRLFDSEVAEYLVVTSEVDAVSADGFKVCKESGNVVIYSDRSMQLPLYSINGILVKTIGIDAGRNVIDDPGSGIFIIGNVRIRL